MLISYITSYLLKKKIRSFYNVVKKVYTPQMFKYLFLAHLRWLAIDGSNDRLLYILRPKCGFQNGILLNSLNRRSFIIIHRVSVELVIRPTIIYAIPILRQRPHHS